MFKKLAVSLLVASLTIGTVYADDYSAMDVATLTQKAEQGDAAAQRLLSYKYAAGEDVKPSDTTAFHWFNKAANQGVVDAQYNLGVMYGKGQGVTKNLTTAKAWFGKACDNGYQDGCDAYRLLNR